MNQGNDKFERDFETFLNEGDAHLSALYGKLPQAEPDARLDAAVIAMAHRALNPELVATPPTAHGGAARRRARWLPALGAAATAVFALGVAVKMGPQLWTQRDATPAASTRDDGVVHVRTIDAPVAATPPPASPPPPPANAFGNVAPARQEAMARVAPKPAPAPTPAPVLQKPVPEAPVAAAAQASDMDRKAQLKKTETAAAPAGAPQAFPAKARPVEMDAVERKQAIAEGAWQRLHEAEAPAAPPAGGATAAKALRGDLPSSPPATTAAPPAAPRSKAAAADAAATPREGRAEEAQKEKEQALDTITVTGSNIRRVDVETSSPVVTIDKAAVNQAAQPTPAPRAEPQQAFAPPPPPQDKDTPASRNGAGLGFAGDELAHNARLYPESWMAAIQRLVRDGRREDARRNLELFRKKYPDYHLTDEIERFWHETP